MSRASIRARVAAATPGPWRAEFGIIWSGGSSIGEMDDERDAPLVAHARQDIPALLAVADAAFEVLRAKDPQSGSARAARDELTRAFLALEALP